MAKQVDNKELWKAVRAFIRADFDYWHGPGGLTTESFDVLYSSIEDMRFVVTGRRSRKGAYAKLEGGDKMRKLVHKALNE